MANVAFLIRSKVKQVLEIKQSRKQKGKTKENRKINKLEKYITKVMTVIACLLNKMQRRKAE